MLKAEIKQTGKETRVFLKGPINEETSRTLSDVYPKAEQTIIFDFEDVDYINSLGIRSWINFLRNIQEGRTIIFENCTPDVVMQMNLIANFKGAAEVKSFYGEYSCDHCGHEGLVKFENDKSSNLQDKVENQNCPQCGESWRLEDDEESYLQFLE
ncbi:MAG: STAS domain-containing protein [Pseudobacteriovorax sp.]|nr:STAS domain-containing protein [Pseudobacteriovorax sp.]